ncbi:MAG: SGNH/GDSL hydrolase family protein [Alphaproteobacteria bacterium]
MTRFERHPRLTLAAVVAVFFVACLAATETYLAHRRGSEIVAGGSSAPSPERSLALREWMPNTRFAFAPPEARYLRPGGPVHDVYPVDTDADGFIEPSRVHDHPDVTIVFLGGSTTECMFVTPETRFPYLAGRLLERKTRLAINSLNGGKSGNNTLHSTLILIGKVVPLHPDYVVLMHNANDQAMLARLGSYWADDPDLALVRTRKRNLETVVRDLRDMTIPRTYRAAKRTWLKLKGALTAPAAKAAEDAARPSPTTALDPEVAAKWGKQYESALRQFVVTARAWGIRPVLMTQAQRGGASDIPVAAGGYLNAEALARHGLTPESFASAHDYFNAIVRQVAQSEGVPLVDLAAERWTDADIYDGLHFNDAGSARAAEIIADGLAPLIARDRASNRTPAREP